MSTGLSNRVMNMKFMQKAEDSKLGKQKLEEQKKIHDLSEWVLPDSAKLLKLAAMKPKIERVGFGTIMTNGSYNYSSTIKRSWGSNVSFEEIEDSESNNVEDIDDEPLDLNTMWRKRKLESPSNSNKKKRFF
ncbi:conserved hypothetical protein [Candida dubliniensis CD36]|uniref:M-phase phosphoprotein 6 n=1 Tax=Candida dubliniensis (strain CD36 / ATCC MYA-646 / CBS 7987 / NCPF 3949 / NRRL Y-17841) TaxID=573826 RepID=B9WKS3_CANDC|nr:conserved hypothetical protein [Candida dubliniensis CD36]CAX39623.1 conserved hypothetical protein [Candida dubliniensis CD36]